MTQIFRESSNSLSLFTLLFVGVGVAGFFFAYWLYWGSPAETRMGVVSSQPVAFSHKHHVKGVGLDCRFCHAHADQSNTAGMPSTEVCMSCHSQLFTQSPQLAPVRESWKSGKPLEWTRVNWVPDFVYFDHSIHVNKGVNCLACHGQMDEMQLTSKSQPLSMEWCLKCHFGPEKYLRDRDEVYSQHPAPQDIHPRVSYTHLYHVDAARLRNCYECHR